MSKSLRKKKKQRLRRRRKKKPQDPPNKTLRTFSQFSPDSLEFYQPAPPFCHFCTKPLLPLMMKVQCVIKIPIPVNQSSCQHSKLLIHCEMILWRAAMMQVCIFATNKCVDWERVTKAYNVARIPYQCYKAL